MTNHANTRIPKLVSLSEASVLLRLKPSTLYKVPAKILPRQKCGGKLLYREVDIIKYLDMHYQH